MRKQVETKIPVTYCPVCGYAIYREDIVGKYGFCPGCHIRIKL